MNFYTYIHRRNDTGAIFYVGKGRGRRAYDVRSRNTYWKNVVGKAGHSVEMLITGVDEELAFFIETEAIDLYRMRGIKLVNLTDGGDGASGYSHSESTKQSMSISRKGRKAWNKGAVVPQEVKDKISASNKGQKAWNKGIQSNQEHREKISKSLIGNDYHKGKLASVETKRRMSIAQTGRLHSEETKRKISAWNVGKLISQKTRDAASKASSKSVLCVTTGEIFPSIIAAARHFGMRYGTSICECCRGKTKSTHGKVFRYI